MPDAQGLYLIVWQHLHGFGFLKQTLEGENGVVLAIDFIESLTSFDEAITKNAEAVIDDAARFANCVHGVYCASTCRDEIFD